VSLYYNNGTYQMKKSHLLLLIKEKVYLILVKSPINKHYKHVNIIVLYCIIITDP